MTLYLGIALFSLILCWLSLSVLVGYEERQGTRVVLAGARQRSDHFVMWATAVFAAFVRYVDRHVIRLSWYYSLHSLLQAALRVVVSVYDYLEQWFHHNRKRARALRAERRQQRRVSTPVPTTILTSIAEHKENVALTDRQKQKLKSKSLERG